MQTLWVIGILLLALTSCSEEDKAREPGEISIIDLSSYEFDSDGTLAAFDCDDNDPQVGSVTLAQNCDGIID